MSTESLLLKEYVKILETGEFSDTEILVGEAPNDKVFHLHSFVLKICSPYFRTALSDEWKKVENNIIKFKKPNIPVKVFEILVKYMYSGKIELANHDVKTIVALLIAADELCLNDLCIFIEGHLLKDGNSLKRNFVLIQNVVNKFTQFTKLSQFYKDAFQQDPSLIFKAEDFTTIDQETLFDLVKKNPLNPIEMWDKLMEWSIAQPNELPSDVTKWTDSNVTTFGTLIKPFIPHINFKGICRKDFFHKVKPFKNIFDDKDYIKILEYYSFDNIVIDDYTSQFEVPDGWDTPCYILNNDNLDTASSSWVSDNTAPWNNDNTASSFWVSDNTASTSLGSQSDNYSGGRYVRVVSSSSLQPQSNFQPISYARYQRGKGRRRERV